MEGGCTTHLEGIGDSYTLCGMDVAGDDSVHRKPPETLSDGKPHRLTCEHCQQIVALVREHLRDSVSRRTQALMKKVDSLERQLDDKSKLYGETS